MNNNKKCIPIYGRLSQSGGSGSGSGGGGGIIPIGTKEINITENGTTEYDVTPYAKAAVTVDVQKTGSKDIDITANGTTTENVQDVGSVNINVNVPTEKPTGSKAFEFTQNGEYPTDVADIATANISVNVPTETPTGSKALTYTANGTYSEDVAAVATADIEVNVPQPAGSTIINVNANGESDHDVTDYATAHVVVDVPKPTAKKTVNIVANGTTTEDVADFGSVDINVNVSGGGDESKNILDALISGSGSIDTLTSDVRTLRNSAFSNVENVKNYVFPNLERVPASAFSSTTMDSISLPYAYSFYTNAFSRSGVHVISAPQVVTIMPYALDNCHILEEVSFPECIRVDGYAFRYSNSLVSISLPKATNVNQSSFNNLTVLKKLILGECDMQSGYCTDCSALEVLFVDPPTEIFLPSLKKSLIMRNIKNVPRLLGVTSPTNTPTGIYVPDSLVEDFKTASNWSEYADRIKPVSEYIDE